MTFVKGYESVFNVLNRSPDVECVSQVFTSRGPTSRTSYHFQWRIQDFPEEGALTPKGGHQSIIWPIFPENCMKMKKFWARGGGRASLALPLRSATDFDAKDLEISYSKKLKKFHLII